MFIKYSFIFFICLKFIYAEEVISSKFFDKNFVTIENGQLSDVNQNLSTDRLIGDDTLPKGDIKTDNYHNNNLRKVTNNIVVNEHGNTVYLNENNEEVDIQVYREPDDFNTSKEKYIDLYKKISSKEHEDRISLLEEDRNIYQQKLKNLEMAKDVDLTVENMKSFSSGALNKAEYSQSYFSQDINNIEAKLNSGKELSQEDEDELAATKYYKETYGFIPKNPDGHGTKKSLEEKNVGALGRAFNEIDSLVDFYKSRIGTPLVKCQISRELIPSYYCPISGLDGIRYPTNSNTSDIRKTDINMAKKDCEKNCITPSGFYPTIEEQMISDINANIDFGLDREAFPNFDNTLGIIEFDGNEIVPLRDVNLTIKFTKPEFKPDSEEEMTDEEWQDIINEHRPVIKFSFWYEHMEGFEDKDNQIPKYIHSPLYTQKQLIIHSPLQKFSFPIFKVGRKYKIVFYKPFFKYTASDGILREYDTKMLISNIEGRYTSTSFHYCSIYQMVSNPRDCKDRTKVKLVNVQGVPSDVISSLPGSLSQPGQSIYVCADSESKIGPEPVWGAFYTDESAKKACVAKSECIPTYNHSFSPGSDPSVFYRPVIDCVDDPENLNCTKELCETLFPSIYDTVINEYQPYSDIAIRNGKQKSSVKNIYSISNSIRTEVPRPKINFDEVFLNNVDYEAVFNDEEKDQAYLYMVENLRYNRSAYRIGEESPVSLGYNIVGNNKGVAAIIKPNSFDFDSDNDLNMYSIMRIESNFKPSAGIWTVNNISIGTEQERNPDSTDPYIKRIQDVTYLIKTGEGINDWSVFRRIQNNEFFIETITFVWNEEDMSLEERKTSRWSQIPAYVIDNFELYIGDNNWGVFDRNGGAPSFTKTKFPINQNKFSFVITEDYKAVSQLEGILFGSQITINNGLNFLRDYTIPADLDLSEASLFGFDATGYEDNWDKMSYVDNIEYYMLYDATDKSYLELIEEIEGVNWSSDRTRISKSKWGVYSNRQPVFFRKGDIKYDGEINNNIKFIVKGKPENITLGVDWDPTRIEKGQKVYKFSFLFDDPEYKPFDIK